MAQADARDRMGTTGDAPSLIDAPPERHGIARPLARAPGPARRPRRGGWAMDDHAEDCATSGARSPEVITTGDLRAGP